MSVLRTSPKASGLNSTSVCSRQKQSVSYDPSCDGWPIPYDHWQSAYAYENHERSCGDVYEVEMYVSLNNFCGLITRITNFFQLFRPRVTIPVAGERTAKLEKKQEITDTPPKKIHWSDHVSPYSDPSDPSHGSRNYPGSAC